MKIHVNVMELLIEQEIVRYLKKPEYKHLRGDIVPLMTYALNRVPPLYASSVQGLKSQINRAKQDYCNHIENAVRWSFSAVNKAPRLQSPDLTREIYQRVLAQTRSAVRQRELSPIDLPEMIDSMVVGWDQNDAGDAIGLVPEFTLDPVPESVVEASSNAALTL
ncbi:MAG: hypothetical protein HC771_18085 [Synechococcales cyanobacterium CRU_2_2]|nr:hypothetical protein [Synechococcales cyanobacterium CRU_2_2]